MFKVGDRVIHNSFGLCRISAIGKEDAYSGREDCYIFYIEKTKIIIPVAHADILRYPMKKEEVPTVFEALENVEAMPSEISYRNFVDAYTKRMSSNNVSEIASCLRDLTFLNEKSTLKGPAKNLFETINKILVDEISFIKNISRVEAQRLISRSLSKAKERIKCSTKKQ